MPNSDVPFCPFCGAQNVETELKSLENKKSLLANDLEQLAQAKSLQQAELDSLATKRNTLANDLKALEASVAQSESARQSLESKKDVLANHIKKLEQSIAESLESLESLEKKKAALAFEIGTLEKRRNTEVAELASLQDHKSLLTNEVQALQKESKRRRAAKGRPRTTQIGREAPAPQVPKQETHTFVYEYEGKEDWSTELAKVIAQFGVSLGQADYSAAPEKIILSVNGTRESLEKLVATLSNVGFVNLRTKLAETKRRLRESVNAMNAHKEQLAAIDRLPWYRRGVWRRSLDKRKAINEKLAEDNLKVKATLDDLHAIERLLSSSDESKSANGDSDANFIGSD